MKHTRPLKELIAELQALEDANPGIRVIANDNEWGADTPKVAINLVYINEHDHVILVDDEAMDLKKKTLDFYKDTPEAKWESFGEDKGSNESFEQFKTDYERTKAYFEAEMEEKINKGCDAWRKMFKEEPQILQIILYT